MVGRARGRHPRAVLAPRARRHGGGRARGGRCRPRPRRRGGRRCERGPPGPSARGIPPGRAGALAAAAEDRALRGVARAAAPEGRAGDRAGRRRPRHHDRHPAPIGPAGRDRARPGLPPRAQSLHAPRAADLPPRSRSPAPRRRPGAVLVDGHVGRSRGARRRRSTAAPRAAGRAHRAGHGRGGGRCPPALRPRPALRALRRHGRAPQEPAPPGRGVRAHPGRARRPASWSWPDRAVGATSP